MITVTGIPVYSDNDNAPSLFDVGTGLSRMFRFAGQTRIPYPVLAHVFTVANIVDNEHKAHALLHDAGEAVVGDQVTPWKNHATKHSEETILKRIYRDLGLGWPIPEAAHWQVLEADRKALRAEAVLLGHAEPENESFKRVELDEKAVEYTREHMKIPLTQWLGFGWSGQQFASAIHKTIGFAADGSISSEKVEAGVVDVPSP